MEASVTTQQIETLQQQIRSFKALSKRLADSPAHTALATSLSGTNNNSSDSMANYVGNFASASNVGAMGADKVTSNPTSGINNASNSGANNAFSNASLPTFGMISGNSQSNSTGANTSFNPNMPNGNNPNTAVTSSQGVSTSISQPISQSQQASAPQQPTVNPLAPAPSLSWQCFSSLLFPGPSKSSPDGMIGLAMADMGCFSKSAHYPLILTLPYATSIREKYLHASIQQKNTDKILNDQDKLWMMQRQMRASLVNSISQSNIVRSGQQKLIHPPGTHGLESHNSELLVRRNFMKVKRQVRRDDKRRRNEQEDNKRKAIMGRFHKALMTHRDEMLRNLRNKRQDLIKLSRTVKQHVESLDARRERDGARAEAARIKALRDNDMESYMRLVQETKNVRLQYLLNETDSYIAKINEMIQQQRGGYVESTVSSSGDHDKLTSQTFFSNTHRVVEGVVQPRMLKGGELTEYQLSGLQWLMSLYNNNLNGILADEMGLGKTIQTIALLTYVMEVKHNSGPFLIVCPLSTLSNWTNEVTKWAPDMIRVVYKGAPATRKLIYKNEIESGRFNVLLTTYEYIMKDRATLKRIDWQYIIVDEGHRMKNAQSKFTQILGAQYNSRHRVLLTGTPLQNSLPELWSLLNFLLPTIFSSVDTFDQWFNKPFAAFKNQNSEMSNEGDDIALSQEEQMLIIHRLHEVLRPFVLRRVKSQVLDQLPEKVEKVLRCDFSGFQKRMYKAIEARRGRDNNAQGVNNVWMQLRKVCNHPYLFLQSYIIDHDMIRISGKFEMLDRMLPKLRAAGHRVLMFSQMTQLMTILEQFFAFRRYHYLRLDGNTNAEEREKRMYQFNDPNSPYFIFLLSTRAGGLGLNLATADTVIIFDSDWNPMMDSQAQDRAHRMGQKNEVRVFRLITNSWIEEKILARATNKLNLTGLVVEAGKFNQGGGDEGISAKRRSTNDDNEGMVDDMDDEYTRALLKEYAQGGAEGTFGNDADFLDETNGADNIDDDELNDIMAVNERETQLYQKCDRINAANSSSTRLLPFLEKPKWLQSDTWAPKFLNVVQIMDSMKTAKSMENDTWYDENNSDNESENSDKEDDANIVGGKSMRKRKNEVIYDDGLTDQQYARMLENNEPITAGKKTATRRSTSSASLAAPAVSIAGKDSNALPGSIRISAATCNRMLKIIQEIGKIKNSLGYYITQLFKEKPDRKTPEYYEIIEFPIALKDINAKLRKMQYARIEDVLNDFALMSYNARAYNGNENTIYYDAERIRNEFFMRLLSSGMVQTSLEVTPVLPADTYKTFNDDEIVFTDLSLVSADPQLGTMGETSMAVDEEEGTAVDTTVALKIKKLTTKRPRKSAAMAAENDGEGIVDVVGAPKASKATKTSAKKAKTPKKVIAVASSTMIHSPLILSIKRKPPVTVEPIEGDGDDDMEDDEDVGLNVDNNSVILSEDNNNNKMDISESELDYKDFDDYNEDENQFFRPSAYESEED